MCRILATLVCALVVCGALLGCAASDETANAAAPIDVAYVKANASAAQLLDVRDFVAYAGVRDDDADRNGHIPGAVNIPYENMLDKDGEPISTTRLERIFKHANLLPEGQIIVYGAGSDDASAVAGLLASCGYTNAVAWTEGYQVWADDSSNEIEKSSLTCCGAD